MLTVDCIYLFTVSNGSLQLKPVCLDARLPHDIMQHSFWTLKTV